MSDLPPGFVLVDDAANNIVARKPKPISSDLPEGFYVVDSKDPKVQTEIGAAQNADRLSGAINKSALNPGETVDPRTGRISAAIVPRPSTKNDIVHAINAVPEYLGTEAGKYVQSKVEPVLGGTASDIAGALTKEALQFFGPQAASTGLRGLLKGAALIAPGAQGGRIEHLISKSGQGLDDLLGRTKQSAEGFERAVGNIPAKDVTPLTNTIKTLEDLIGRERAHGIKDTGFLNDAETLLATIKASDGAPSLQWIDGELSRIGKKTKAVQGLDANPGYKRLFGAMAKDLENTAPASAGQRTVQVPRNPTQPAVPQGSETEWFDKLLGKSTPMDVVESRRPIAVNERTFPRPNYPYMLDPMENAAQSRVQQIDVPGLGKVSINGTGVTRNAPVYSEPALVDTLIEKSAFQPNRSAELTKPQTVENIINPSGRGAVIRAKDEALRRNMGVETIVDEFNNLVKTKRGSSGATDINANQLMDKLRKNEFLQKSLRPEDWKEIDPILSKLADVAALPPPSGVSFGSGRAMTRGAVAGTLAHLVGGDPYATAGFATALDYGVGQMLMTRQGRSTIKKVLDMGLVEKSQTVNILNAVARGASGEFTDEPAK